MNLSTGQQAVLEMRIRDLRLVQYALTDAAVEAGLGTALQDRLADESEAVRKALNEIESVLRVARQMTEAKNDD